jgi:phosphoenolpyruvate synthase/pyruvate phosphate dikinase
VEIRASDSNFSPFHSLAEAADIPADALDKVPNNSSANSVSMTLAAHQLTRELLDKGKGAMARMHSMIFPKINQDKTLGQLIDAFAVDTKEVIEVFKRTSRTYGALLDFQLMMGHGFKADIEKMSRELPKDQDGQFIDLSAFKTSALTCARQLLELVSSKRSSAGPSLSTQNQAP